MAAGTAASGRAETLLLEKMGYPGRKLSLTGLGRCNLTNSAPLEQFLEAFGPNGRFLRQAFMEFFSSDLVAFIEQLGVEIEMERSGRYFASGTRAHEITQHLTAWAQTCGATIRNDCPVTELALENGAVAGVKIGPKKTIPAAAVVIATGGLSYPDTGSTGDGYRLAEAVGHSIIPTRPALVPIETRGEIAPLLQGLSLRDVSVRLMVDDHVANELVGDLLFTHFGLSGPVILQMSRQVADALHSGKRVVISIDLLPAVDERTLEVRLLDSFNRLGTRQLKNILKELLPTSLVAVGLDTAGIPAEITGSQVTTSERRQLRRWLKDFCIDVTGHRSFDEAIITAGGVDLKEVDPRTMQSRLVKGLYFAGEVLDIDGPTGGYNLQAAFSTGRLAGQSAAIGDQG